MGGKLVLTKEGSEVLFLNKSKLLFKQRCQKFTGYSFDIFKYVLVFLEFYGTYNEYI